MFDLIMELMFITLLLTHNFIKELGLSLQYLQMNTHHQSHDWTGPEDLM